MRVIKNVNKLHFTLVTQYIKFILKFLSSAEAHLLNLSIVFLIQRASSIVLFVFYFLHWMFCFWEMMVYYFVGVLSAVVSTSPYASSLGKLFSGLAVLSMPGYPD